MPELYYVDGFAFGAMEVWHKVKGGTEITRRNLKLEVAHMNKTTKSDRVSRRGESKTLVPQNADIAELNTLHGEVMAAARTSLEKAIRMGEILVRLKQHHGHGNWEAFLTGNLPFESRTASNYMGCYQRRNELLKSEIVSDLSLSEAYRKLRSPSKTPAFKKSGPPGGASDADVPRDPVAGGDDMPFGSLPGQNGSPSLTIDLIDHGDENSSIEIPPHTGTIAEDSRGSQLVSEPPPEKADRHPESEEIALHFVNGALVLDWHDGLITTQRIEREFRTIEERSAALPLNVQLAQQRMFVAGACAINRVCGTDPTDHTLKAVEMALSDLRNQVVGHKNFQH